MVWRRPIASGGVPSGFAETASPSVAADTSRGRARGQAVLVRQLRQHRLQRVEQGEQGQRAEQQRETSLRERPADTTV